MILLQIPEINKKVGRELILCKKIEKGSKYMPILTKLKEILTSSFTRTPKNCYFCKRSATEMRNYKDPKNNRIKVCYLCVEYAERRAFPK